MGQLEARSGQLAEAIPLGTHSHGSTIATDNQSMVSRKRFGEFGELSAASPIEIASIHDDAAENSSMSADPLGGRLNDDVGSELDGLDEVSTTAKGVL